MNAIFTNVLSVIVPNYTFDEKEIYRLFNITMEEFYSTIDNPNKNLQLYDKLRNYVFSKIKR